MKKAKIFFAAFVALLSIPCAQSQIRVTMPSDVKADSISVSTLLISSILQPNGIMNMTADIPVVDGVAEIPLSKSPARYQIDFRPFVPELPRGEGAMFIYAGPGEEINLDITSLSPMTFTASGTPLVDAMTALDAAALPLEEEAAIVSQSEDNEGRMQQLIEQYNKIFTDYIAANPNDSGAVYAWLNIQDPEQAVALFPMLGAEAQQSIIYPIAEAQFDKQQQRVERKRAQEAMKGQMAPDFTLPDLQGQEVSLSQFRGKWVVLDFWGSWCGWCVKGFPQLKEAYEKYGDRLAIIGIDSGDTPEDWQKAVERFKLPWVNVYLGKDDSLLQLYGVQGFPTKAIINPQGLMVAVITGEDPGFYTILDKCMAE